jgi:hypothetical protein
MPSVSAPNATIISEARGRIPFASFFVNLPPLVELATAEIQTTPSAYPAYDFAITNTSANWGNPGVAIESQFVRIFKPSGKLAFEGQLRRNATSTLLRLPAQNAGDTGIARQFAQVIQAGDQVVVYDTRRPGSMMSFLDPNTEEQYKRYDDDFDDGTTYGKQTVYPKPVVNMGTHQHKVVGGSGTTAFALSGAGSYSWNGNSIAYLWELPTGVTLLSGTLTSASITVEAVPGAHQIALRVNDVVTGKLKRGYRYLYATDGIDGDYPAFSDAYAPLAIESDEHTPTGRKMSIRFKVNRSDTGFWNSLYTGAQVYIKYQHEYSDDDWHSQDKPSAGLIEEYTGFIRSYEVEISKYGIKSFVVHLESALQFFGALPIAAQLIKESASPASWQEVPVGFNNLAFYVYYVFEYHAPSILQLSDFDYGDFNNLRMFGLNIPAGSIAGAAQFVVNSRPGANIGVTSSGKIVMRRHPWVESTGYRNAVPVVWTLTAADVRERLGFPLNPIMRNGLTYGSGLVWGSGNTTMGYKAWTGGFAMAQGVNRETMQDFTASSESEILQIVGHWHQMSNAPVEAIELDIISSRDVFEPALMERFQLSLEDYDPTEGDIPAELFTESQMAICTSVRRTWVIENNALIHKLSCTFQPETRGEPAVPYEIPPRGSGLVSLPTDPVVSEYYDWNNTVATPPGWSQLGAVTPTTWVNWASFPDGNYPMSRSVNTDWASTYVMPGVGTLGGIKRVYSAPITLNSITTKVSGNAGNTKRVGFAVKYSSGTIEMIFNTVYSFDFTNPRTSTWAGTLADVVEIYILYLNGASTGIAEYINETGINS